MSGSTSANRKLHSSLRHFLVLARLRKLDSTSWHSLKDDILAELQHEDESVLESAIKALRTEKSCVPLSEWVQCIEHIKNLLHNDNREKLVGFLEADQLQSDSRSLKRRLQSKPVSSNVTLSSPRKRIRPSSSNAYRLDSSRGPVFQHVDPQAAGFYVLKTPHVKDHCQSLSIDDIVVAGATFAVICNFKYDVAWMWDRAPALQTYQKIVIVHGESPEEEDAWKLFLRHHGFESRVRFARPVTPPYGTVHSKLMILCFPTTCRVCIHTANMVQSDWDSKTQGAYMRDFPVHNVNGKVGSPHASGKKDPFKTELLRYFEHCLAGESKIELLKSLNMYDFSSAGVELVASVPGTHRGRVKDAFGHARLRHLLRKEQFLSKTEPSTAVCQFSSLGSIQEKWIDQEFHDTLFASMDSEEFATSLTRAKNQIKLVFPTVQQVFQSNEGVQAGLSLPVHSRNLHRDHITRKLCRWEGAPIGRNKAMPHIKTYLRYPNSQPNSPCWFFLGSFNLSVAAWGRMQGATKSKPWDRLNVLSYEMGVLFLPNKMCSSEHNLQPTVKHCIPVTENDVSSTHPAAAAQGPKALISGTLPNRQSCDQSVKRFHLPYQIPPPPYRKEDVAWTLYFYTFEGS